MLHASETDITLGLIEDFADGIPAVRGLGAIHGAAREQGGQFRDGKSVQLVLEDMIDPFLTIGNLTLKSRVQPFGDFA